MFDQFGNLVGGAAPAVINGQIYDPTTYNTQDAKYAIESYKQLLRNCVKVIDAVIPLLDEHVDKEIMDQVKALSRTAHLMDNMGYRSLGSLNMNPYAPNKPFEKPPY